MFRIFLVFLSAAFIPVSVRAQTQAAKPQELHVQDGGTREVLESITVPPKPNAPFTLTLQTEWVRNLGDGGTITLVNERRIARDGRGRIYQERWLLVPKSGNQKSQMNAIQISDPTSHELYTCWMIARRVCELTSYGPTTSTVYEVEGPPSGPLPNEAGYVIHDKLGTQSIAGMDTVGTRVATVYNAGVFGNDRKMTVEREFWSSPQLEINLLSKRSDPRFGAQTFTVTSLSPSEPDPQLFELPEGFMVEDRRTTPAPN